MQLCYKKTGMRARPDRSPTLEDLCRSTQSMVQTSSTAFNRIGAEALTRLQGVESLPLANLKDPRFSLRASF